MENCQNVLEEETGDSTQYEYTAHTEESVARAAAVSLFNRQIKDYLLSRPRSIRH